MEIKTARNPEQAGIDECRFGLENQKLWLKQNFSKMEKMMILKPKDGIRLKKVCINSKTLIINGHAETHQLCEFRVILTLTPGLLEFNCL